MGVHHSVERRDEAAVGQEADIVSDVDDKASVLGADVVPLTLVIQLQCCHGGFLKDEGEPTPVGVWAAANHVFMPPSLPFGDGFKRKVVKAAHDGDVVTALAHLN